MEFIQIVILLASRSWPAFPFTTIYLTVAILKFSEPSYAALGTRAESVIKVIYLILDYIDNVVGNPMRKLFRLMHRWRN